MNNGVLLGLGVLGIGAIALAYASKQNKGTVTSIPKDSTLPIPPPPLNPLPPSYNIAPTTHYGHWSGYGSGGPTHS